MNSILQRKLGLECPIVQAPMAGGPTTPELLVAVASAGALGSFGFAYSTPEQIHTLCQSYRHLGASGKLDPDCGWNANFFVFPEIPQISNNRVAAAVKGLEFLARRVSIDTDALNHVTRLPLLRDQIEAALQYNPSLISFHLGVPPSDLVKTIHDAGCHVAMSATSLPEAKLVQQSGADFIVAQGYEAGGHRGIFDPRSSDSRLELLPLILEITAGCEIPVIASGGIMNGQDIASAISNGADAVQMGSAFLTVDECGSSALYRAAVDLIGDRETQLTTGFSGRPARGIRNLFMDKTDEANNVLPFPLQNTLTGAIRKAAASKDDFELMSLWAGTRFSKARNCSTAKLIHDLREETAVALAGLT